LGAVVDNAGSGGILAIVNIDSGKIETMGHDDFGNKYEKHPDSNITYIGWQVPKWKELVEMATEMHMTIMSEHKYIGWDFALTDNGWVVIEGNWGQYVAKQTCTKEDYKPIFEKYLK
jgi:hypothetical protein